MTDNLNKPFSPDWAGYQQGVKDGKAEADAWHAAILAECQLTEACYVEADPAGTVRRLIDWHVAVAAAVPQPTADLHAALRVAVRQNEHDMLMTGEELRAARAALTAAAALVAQGGQHG
jgi:hypothetical protein